MKVTVFPAAANQDYGHNHFPPPQVTGGAGGGAPTDATYVTMSLNASLSAERVLTAGDGITITDGGANGNVTISMSTTPATFNWAKYIAGRGFFPNGGLY